MMNSQNILLFLMWSLLTTDLVLGLSADELKILLDNAAKNPPCFHLEALSRAKTSYEPGDVTIKTLHGTKVKIHKDVKFCVIKDGEKCFPENFNTQDGEYQTLQTRMSVGYWDTATTPLLPIIEPLGDTTDVERNFRADLGKYDQKYRSFSCKSGLCENFHCAAGTRETNGVAEMDYAEIQTGMQRIHRWQVDKEKLKMIDCKYYNDHFSNKAFPAPARVKVKKDSDEYLIGLCLLPSGASCFPKNEVEFGWFKKHMEAAHVLSPDLFKKEDKEDKALATTNRSLVLMSWNCESGVCDNRTQTCEAGDRRARVWNVYDYNAGPRTNSVIQYGFFMAVIQYWLITASN